MTRRHLLLFALAAVLVLLSAGVWLLCLTDDGATTVREAAGQVKIGMTLAEVDLLFGRPADKVHKNIPVHGGDRVDFTHTMRQWRASNGTIAAVTFNRNEVVSGTSGIFEPPTMMQLVRHWLGL